MPGVPEGIAGPALLDRMRSQAERYGARIVAGEVTALEKRPGGGFAATVDGRVVDAKRVLLATGGLDVEPELSGVRDAVQRGLTSPQ